MKLHFGLPVKELSLSDEQARAWGLDPAKVKPPPTLDSFLRLCYIQGSNLLFPGLGGGDLFRLPAILLPKLTGTSDCTRLPDLLAFLSRLVAPQRQEIKVEIGMADASDLSKREPFRLCKLCERNFTTREREREGQAEAREALRGRVEE